MISKGAGILTIPAEVIKSLDGNAFPGPPPFHFNNCFNANIIFNKMSIPQYLKTTYFINNSFINFLFYYIMLRLLKWMYSADNTGEGCKRVSYSF